MATSVRIGCGNGCAPRCASRRLIATDNQILFLAATLTQETVRTRSTEIRHDVSDRTRRPCHEDGQAYERADRICIESSGTGQEGRRNLSQARNKRGGPLQRASEIRGLGAFRSTPSNKPGEDLRVVWHVPFAVSISVNRSRFICTAYFTCLKHGIPGANACILERTDVRAQKTDSRTLAESRLESDRKTQRRHHRRLFQRTEKHVDFGRRPCPTTRLEAGDGRRADGLRRTVQLQAPRLRAPEDTGHCQTGMQKSPQNRGLRCVLLPTDAGWCRTPDHSHSIVAGGLPEMSYTTRLIPRTSLMIRFDARPSSAYGRCAQCAVMKSVVCTARSDVT
ncbi:hypothetical protein BLA50215_01963 [Burkholderia lata]|nr:hypothetical protein BLA50215_01963 [Burkholderia lata]